MSHERAPPNNTDAWAGNASRHLKKLKGLSKGPYPLGHICRIGDRSGNRIGHRRPILAPILMLILVGMTHNWWTWPTLAG